MPKHPKLSDANFEIMKIIWDLGEATVKEIHEAIKKRRFEPIKRESIQVQVKRLARYGWLRRRKEGKNYHYSSVSGQEEVNRDILDDVKDRVFGGSQTELIKCLLKNTDVQKEEMERIRKLLSVYEKRKT